VRWEALRQLLGCDAAAGQACLEKVAANVTDPLQLPAAALLHTLSHARTYVNTSEQETA